MIPYLCRDEATRFVFRHHLAQYHAAQISSGKQTGRMVVEKAGLECVVGEANRFYWRTRVVMLTEKVANGSDPISICTSLHEVSHSMQPRWLVALASFLWPVSWYAELKCWSSIFGKV